MPVAHLSGELDLDNAPGIFRSITARVDGTGLVIDLSEVTFMDSVSLSEIVEISRRQPVRLVAPHGGVARRLLDLTGLDRAMATYDDVGAALSGA
jgi:anti-anti-sigma factor